MTTPQRTSTPERTAARERRGRSVLPAFLIGVPLGTAVLLLIHFALQGTQAERYVSHAVEQVEVVMFCCALGALGTKLWNGVAERRALAADVLPAWNGQRVPVTEATTLLSRLARLPRRLQDTYLVRRVGAVLSFLCSRGSAAELDDQLRALSDNDALAVENSNSLVRLITWAIPILGFLGTVLGITQSISGVTPEKLEHNINEVTDGLALAFDATALALALTMIAMLLSYLVDRGDQAILEAVDAFAERQLAHRFERGGADESKMVAVVRDNSTALLRTTEQLVQRQADVWARALEEVDRRRAEAEKRQQDRLSGALEAALEKTLQNHAQRLAGLEKQFIGQTTGLLEQLAVVSAGVREQTTALLRMQDGETQLHRAQELLNQNLTAVTAAGTFEQALHSLTAAVHLLTARTGAVPAVPHQPRAVA